MRPFLAAIVSLAVGDPARGDGLFRRNGADVATCDEANAGAGGSYWCVVTLCHCSSLLVIARHCSRRRSRRLVIAASSWTLVCPLQFHVLVFGVLILVALLVFVRPPSSNPALACFCSSAGHVKSVRGSMPSSMCYFIRLSGCWVMIL